MISRFKPLFTALMMMRVCARSKRSLSALIVSALFLSTSLQTALAVPGDITTIAGNGISGYTGDYGPATSANLNNPYSSVADSTGNIYIADYMNHSIRKIDVAGVITTLAGNGSPGYAGDGGPAAYATMNMPAGLAVDTIGNVYIADGGNNCIRKIDTSGIITTVAGNGIMGYSGDGGPAASASLSYPAGVFADSIGNLYIADSGNNRIRMVDIFGTITTVAGDGLMGFSGDGGPGISASLNYPSGVFVDIAGNLYIADSSNNRIRRIDAFGTITTFAGTGAMGYSGDGVPAVSTSLSYPWGVYGDAAGNIYITDMINQRIRKIDVFGIITTVAGNGVMGFSGDFGPAASANFAYPMGISIDQTGNIYVADMYNQRIRRIEGNGADTTTPTGSISINSGSTYANSTNVTLTLSCDDSSGSGCGMMRFSNDGISWSPYEPYATSKSWAISSGDGSKTVYVIFRDNTGNDSIVYSASIVLDATAPSTFASPAGGSYSTVQTVTLACNDGTGSGCFRIYYTTSGATPTTASPVYSSPLTIASSMTLKFLAVDMAGNAEAVKSETYTFVSPTSKLTITKAGTGTGSVSATPVGISCGTDCTESYMTGTVVTLTATPDPGSIFVSWGGNADCADGVVTMDVAKTCRATFNLPKLTITKAGTGTGTVASAPAGISCGADCTENYYAGTVVTLTATPDPGSLFTSWSGNADCVDGIVTMDAAKTCRANFNLPKLTITKTGTGTGTVTSNPIGISCGADCTENYSAGTVVALTATPDAGSFFGGWSGTTGCTGTVTMNASKTCSARFVLQNVAITPPTATTGAASNLTSSTATLNGIVNPKGRAATVYFEWGTDANYGYTTPLQSIASGTADVGVSATISGLTAYTTYHYRVVAYNAGGPTYGVDQTFTVTGIVWAWGANWSGQLGDGTTNESHSPVNGNGLADVIAIAAGGHHSIALKSDGTVWSWGANSSGQLGDSTTTDRHSPVQVYGLTGVTAITAGAWHSAALKADGTVWTWGSNYSGQLGDGTTIQRNIPVQVTGLSFITAIAAGGDHNIALKSNGSIWTWGNNNSGQLGDGTMTDRYSPVPLSGFSNVTTIAAGGQESYVLQSDGTVWSWGSNTYGQLGDGTSINRDVPVPVIGLTGVTAIAPGPMHATVLRNDGTVWSWGFNSYGNLGDGTQINRYTPVQVSGLIDVTIIGGSSAIKSDGTLWTWGLNNNGQLGDGTTTDRLAPVQIMGLTGIKAISGGGGWSHTVAIQ